MELTLRIKTFVLSFFTRNFNNINLHNLEKFIQIKKIWFNINLDSVQEIILSLVFLKESPLSFN